MKRKRKLPKYVSAFVDRHGKERFIFRRTGWKPTYAKHHPGTEEFNQERNDWLAGGAVQPGERRAALGTIDDLASRFYKTNAFLNAGSAKQASNRGIIERFRAEFGDDLVSNFTFAHIEAVLQARSVKRKEGKRMVGGPMAARSLHKQLKRMFRLAVKLKWIETNPADLAETVKAPKTGGFHTWTEEEIVQYRRRHPLGTKGRLAQEIILWTWQRRGDASRFGPPHVKGARMKYTQGKSGKTLWLPMAPELLAAIAAMPSVGITTYLVTEFGKPFTPAGFGNWFRDRCDEAGLPQCSAHGLRKAGARRAADNGATNQMLKAVGGWSGDTEVAIYTADADQERLANATLSRLFEEKGNDD